MYNEAKRDILEEYLPINQDVDPELVERNKVLREEYAQNIKTLANMKSCLYPYRWRFLPSGT